MIDINQQEQIFIAIGGTLEKKVCAYAIGGTAMMLRGIKDATLDVDLVFDSVAERETFIAAFKKLGAKESDTVLIYGTKPNTPHMLEMDNARFDLFLSKIITSNFSDNMRERAKQIHEFGKNLIIKAADPHDVLIMKSATSRIKDTDDISKIITKVRIDWDLIINEANEQVKLGNERAVLDLGTTLERLKNQNKLPIPSNVLNSLWKMLKDQISSKITSKPKKDKIKTISKSKPKNKR